MLELSPDLKMGMTFAILNWTGTTPQENESLKMWKRGSISDVMVCLRKLVEIPQKSGVFLSLSSFVASRISSLVRGLLLKLKRSGFWGMRHVGDLEEGFTFWTVLLAMLVKNSLSWFAIKEGSLIIVPLIVRWEMSLLFDLFLLMEENRICQVFLKFFWLASNWRSKYNFLAFFITRL